MSGYPVTRHSVVVSLAAPDAAVRSEAADLLVRAYRPPVLAALRHRWNLDGPDAEDAAQEFFARLMEKRWLDRYDPARGRFRTFLRVCLDRFASNFLASAQRLKRGGGFDAVDLDAVQIPAASEAADHQFRQEWVRTIFAMAIEGLREDAATAGKAIAAVLFEEYDVIDHPDDLRPTYRTLSERHGIPETQVTNHLSWARRSFRMHVLGSLRALAGSDAEFRDDARELLGITVE